LIINKELNEQLSLPRTVGLAQTGDQLSRSHSLVSVFLQRLLQFKNINKCAVTIESLQIPELKLKDFA